MGFEPFVRTCKSFSIIGSLWHDLANFWKKEVEGGLFLLLLLAARKTHVLTFYEPAHSLALPLPPHWGPSTCYLLPQTPLHTGPRKTTTQATAIIHRGTRYREAIKPTRRIWSTECSLRRTVPLMLHKSTSSCCEEFGCMLSVGGHKHSHSKYHRAARHVLNECWLLSWNWSKANRLKSIRLQTQNNKDLFKSIDI